MPLCERQSILHSSSPLAHSSISNTRLSLEHQAAFPGFASEDKGWRESRSGWLCHLHGYSRMGILVGRSPGAAWPRWLCDMSHGLLGLLPPQPCVRVVSLNLFFAAANCLELEPQQGREWEVLWQLCCGWYSVLCS